MTGTCLCGAVSVTLDERPDFIHDCDCTLCRKTGGAWGYFPTATVATSGPTTTFLRRDKPGAAAVVHSCATCAGTTHWEFSDDFRRQNPDVDLMGVNMRIFDPAELAGVEIRYPSGKAWSGAGAFGYRRAPMTIGDATPW